MKTSLTGSISLNFLVKSKTLQLSGKFLKKKVTVLLSHTLDQSSVFSATRPSTLGLGFLCLLFCLTGCHSESGSLPTAPASASLRSLSGNFLSLNILLLSHAQFSRRRSHHLHSRRSSPPPFPTASSPPPPQVWTASPLPFLYFLPPQESERGRVSISSIGNSVSSS